ncbi:MAG: cyclase family protein, partial [Oscillospiraceae bacterium]|nr:cyclase family protein [Oscillospiraceae bacterium]
MELLDGFCLVDLSVPIKIPSPEELDPTLASSLAAEITYLNHQDTVPLVSNYFGCRKEDLHGGCGWATERIVASSHAGTHVDAPYHYFPSSGGKPARTIDACPLEWFFGRGVVLDMTCKKSGETVSAEDVQQRLNALNYQLRYGDIVCIRYDTDKTFGTSDYWNEHPGLSAEAVRYILDTGVKVIGVDSPGFDIPFGKTKQKFAKSQDKSILWEAHCAGIEYD